VRAFNTAVSEIRTGWQPQLPLELALIESTRPFHEPSTLPHTPAENPDEARPARGSRPTTTSPAGAESGEIDARTITLAMTMSAVRQEWPNIIQRLRDTDNKSNQTLAGLLERAEVTAIDAKSVTLMIDASYKAIFEQRQKTLNVMFQRLFKNSEVFVRLSTRDGTGVSGAPVDDTIVDDPLISSELKSGGQIAHVEEIPRGNE
jgi:hypothetical protein